MNKRVPVLAKTTRSLTLEIKLRKIRYFGHIMRAQKIQKAILTERVEGKEEQGDLGEHGLMRSSSERKRASRLHERGLQQRAVVTSIRKSTNR